jgi:hypothetical protein
MVKIRIVVQENHPRQNNTYIFIVLEFKPRFVLMDLSFNFLAPIELISSGFLTWIKGKWEKS